MIKIIVTSIITVLIAIFSEFNNANAEILQWHDDAGNQMLEAANDFCASRFSSYNASTIITLITETDSA